jgi:hypothetical protein
MDSFLYICPFQAESLYKGMFKFGISSGDTMNRIRTHDRKYMVDLEKSRIVKTSKKMARVLEDAIKEIFSPYSMKDHILEKIGERPDGFCEVLDMKCFDEVLQFVESQKAHYSNIKIIEGIEFPVKNTNKSPRPKREIVIEYSPSDCITNMDELNNALDLIQSSDQVYRVNVGIEPIYKHLGVILEIDSSLANEFKTLFIDWNYGFCEYPDPFLMPIDRFLVKANGELAASSRITLWGRFNQNMRYAGSHRTMKRSYAYLQFKEFLNRFIEILVNHPQRDISFINPWPKWYLDIEPFPADITPKVESYIRESDRRMPLGPEEFEGMRNYDVLKHQLQLIQDPDLVCRVNVGNVKNEASLRFLIKCNYDLARYLFDKLRIEFVTKAIHKKKEKYFHGTYRLSGAMYWNKSQEGVMVFGHINRRYRDKEFKTEGYEGHKRYNAFMSALVNAMANHPNRDIHFREVGIKGYPDRTRYFNSEDPIPENFDWTDVWEDHREFVPLPIGEKIDLDFAL